MSRAWIFLLLTACAAEPARTTVGALEESGAYIAIVADPDHFVAYVCDGAGIAAWFEGAVVDGAFSEESEDGMIEGVVAPEAITGSYTAIGAAPDVYASEDVEGEPYGLWRVEDTFDAREHIGGWVVAPDASQRGALMVSSTREIVENPALDLEAGTAQTMFGAIAVEHVGGADH